MSTPPPTLLTLPLEIRLEILSYTLLASLPPLNSSKPNHHPLRLNILYHPLSPTLQTNTKVLTSDYTHDLWSRQSLTNILLTNHQVQDETTQVLYSGPFTISISLDPAPFTSYKAWIATFSNSHTPPKHPHPLRRLQIRIPAPMYLPLNIPTREIHNRSLDSKNTICRIIASGLPWLEEVRIVISNKRCLVPEGGEVCLMWVERVCEIVRVLPGRKVVVGSEFAAHGDVLGGFVGMCRGVLGESGKGEEVARI